MKKIDPTFTFPPLMKLLGVILILFAIAGLSFLSIKGVSVDFKTPVQIISLGLAFIFFSKEKIDDERIHQFKFRSLMAGFIVTFSMTIGLSHKYNFSAHEFAFSMLTFSVLVFYYAKIKL